jgi:hypothetical protein
VPQGNKAPGDLDAAKRHMRELVEKRSSARRSFHNNNLVEAGVAKDGGTAAEWLPNAPTDPATLEMCVATESG